MKKTTMFFAILLVAGIATARKPKEGPSERRIEVSTSYGKFIFGNLALRQNFGVVKITGSVTNETDRSWSVARFKVRGFDRKGRPWEAPYWVDELARGQTKEIEMQSALEPASLDRKLKLADFEVDFDAQLSMADFDYQFSLIKPLESDHLAMENDAVAFIFTIRRAKFESPSDLVAFSLRNKTQAPVVLDWNRAAFVDLDGESHRVFHTGIKLADRAGFLPPSVVAPGAKIQDMVFPTDYVEWRELEVLGSRWSYRPLFPERDPEQQIGKTFGVLIPLEVNGRAQSYLFTFKISGVNVHQ